MSITSEPEIDNESTEAIVAPETEVVAEQNATTLSPKLFRIASEESEARFSVYETFPEGTAIGRTDQIAGDIIVDFNNPSDSQLLDFIHLIDKRR